MNEGEHVHQWQPNGSVGVWRSDIYRDEMPKYVGLSATTDRIAVLMQCGCGAVGMTVLDRRHLQTACKASSDGGAGTVVVQ